MNAKFSTYLEQTGTTQRQFARECAVREATVSAWANGGMPRPHQMKKIEHVTRGAVPVASWFDGIDLQEQAGEAAE